MTMNNQKIKEAASAFFQKQWDEFSDFEKRVVKRIIEKRPVSRNPIADAADDRTFGERIADKVASFGGSWTFIIIFFTLLLIWVLLNSLILLRFDDQFDPYPYILLNLFLSMLASIQAPIIMMSQNRQAVKDRLAAQHDYEVNLKAELEIIGLHEKLDDLREQKWIDLVTMQQRQIELLETVVSQNKG